MREKLPPEATRGKTCGTDTPGGVQHREENPAEQRLLHARPRPAGRRQNQGGKQGQVQQYKATGNQVTPGCRDLVLVNDTHLPESVLEILTEQRRKRSPWAIPGDNFWRLPNLTSRTGKTQVEFIVLIPDELLVKQPKAKERFLAPAAVRHGVHIARVIDVMEARSAG